jgi:hypothetical protein
MQVVSTAEVEQQARGCCKTNIKALAYCLKCINKRRANILTACNCVLAFHLKRSTGLLLCNGLVRESSTYHRFPTSATKQARMALGFAGFLMFTGRQLKEPI